MAAQYVATAYKLTGDVAAASERRAADMIAPARATGYATETLRSYTVLAALQVLQGRLRTAAATYAEVGRLVPGQDALHALIGSPSYYFGMGDLQREWNNLDAAAVYLACGMELVQTTRTPSCAATSRSHACSTRGATTRRHSRRLTSSSGWHASATFSPSEGAGSGAASAPSAHTGRSPHRAALAEASGLSLDDEPDFLHEAAHLTLARVRIAAGHVEGALPLLDRLLADAKVKARQHSAIEILALQALAYTACADQGRAVASLARALALAAPEGYMHSFVDEGAPMAGLLAQSIAQGALNDALGGYAQKLLAAFPG